MPPGSAPVVIGVKSAHAAVLPSSSSRKIAAASSRTRITCGRSFGVVILIQRRTLPPQYWSGRAGRLDRAEAAFNETAVCKKRSLPDSLANGLNRPEAEVWHRVRHWRLRTRSGSFDGAYFECCWSCDDLGGGGEVVALEGGAGRRRGGEGRRGGSAGKWEGSAGGARVSRV